MLKVPGMEEVSVVAEQLVVPIQERVRVITIGHHIEVNSNSEAPSAKWNKLHEKLSDMGFQEAQIDKYATCVLTWLEALDTMLDADAKATSPPARPHTRPLHAILDAEVKATSEPARPHTKTHPLVRTPALPVDTRVLAKWPEDTRWYPGRMDETHGDIRTGFSYDVAFCDDDKARRLTHTDVRELNNEVRCNILILFLERGVSDPE